MTQFLKRSGQPDLAYVFTPPSEGGGPIIMFCGGYRSDMQGTKASYFEQICAENGLGYLRFDYRGHGQSDGKFEDSTIGQWAQDAVDMLDHIAVKDNQIILIGSSMGGWIGLLMLKHRAKIIRKMIGIAAAPDFTQKLFDDLPQHLQKDLIEKGVALVPNDYSDEPYHFSKAFLEESYDHFVMQDDWKPSCSITLFQGALDIDVPPDIARAIQDKWSREIVDIKFIDDGDHRLSRPQDLELIKSAILEAVS